MKYWKVQESEGVLLEAWSKVYARWNAEKCGGRWLRWDRAGKMCRARWVFKKKNLSKVEKLTNVRAIFNCTKDPSRAEMGVAAKGIALVCATVDLDEFGIGSCLGLVEWLQECEQELRMVHGDDTRFQIVGTDFKDFFPSNDKAEVVQKLEELIGMVMGGRVKRGVRRPKNTWFSALVNGKGKAVWGRKQEAGWVSRQLSDVVTYMQFRAEVANKFTVGDVVLGSEEVIIGEKTSPGMCNGSASLSEHKMCSAMSAAQRSVFGARRYVDDGIRVSVASKENVEVSDALEEEVSQVISQGYPGITVTEEGRAWPGVGYVDMLEYRLGVCASGDRLWWHHRSKNIDSLLSGLGQKFRKLRHWRSGSSTRSMVQTVRARMEDVFMMTRWDGGWQTGCRGSGVGPRDVTVSVVEMLIELMWELGYPSGQLVRMFRGMGMVFSFWNNMVPVVQMLRRMNDVRMELVGGRML